MPAALRAGAGIALLLLAALAALPSPAEAQNVLVSVGAANRTGGAQDRSHLPQGILPAFGRMPLDRIGPEDVTTGTGPARPTAPFAQMFRAEEFTTGRGHTDARTDTLLSGAHRMRRVGATSDDAMKLTDSQTGPRAGADRRGRAGAHRHAARRARPGRVPARAPKAAGSPAFRVRILAGCELTTCAIERHGRREPAREHTGTRIATLIAEARRPQCTESVTTPAGSVTTPAGMAGDTGFAAALTGADASARASRRRPSTAAHDASVRQECSGCFAHATYYQTCFL